MKIFNSAIEFFIVSILYLNSLNFLNFFYSYMQKSPRKMAYIRGARRAHIRIDGGCHQHPYPPCSIEHF